MTAIAVLFTVLYCAFTLYKKLMIRLKFFWPKVGNFCFYFNFARTIYSILQIIKDIFYYSVQLNAADLLIL